ADPLPIGGSGIPPTLLMQDMRHYLPNYLRDFYMRSHRGEIDLRTSIKYLSKLKPEQFLC
ncbi:MAG: hypothetical protein F6K63_35390, partial [Moorea sp. SIO1G6]|uniref:CO2 hydration protein n=1 Tax=Moorena sp. SIO1G6 TaxID=2607840 RepID=UPI0013C15821